MKDNNVQNESWAPFAEGNNNLFQDEQLVAIAEKHVLSVFCDRLDQVSVEHYDEDIPYLTETFNEKLLVMNSVTL